jgi:HK97 gp10 family phage protein
MAKSSGRTPAVVVTGDKALDKALHAFEPKVQRALTRKATRVAAKVVQEAAVLRVPILTGTLEDSLKVRAMRKRKGKRNRRGKFGHSVIASDGFFQGDAFYGGFMEFGTKQRFHKSGKSTGEIEPRSFDFLRPALYEKKDTIRRLFTTTMRQLVLEEGRKKVAR